MQVDAIIHFAETRMNQKTNSLMRLVVLSQNLFTSEILLLWYQDKNLSLSGKTFEKKKKKWLNPQMDSAQIVIFVFVTIIIDNMGKGTHLFGQPVYGQLIKCLNKDKVVVMSRNHGGERYIKSFDGWHQSAHRHISKRERALRCQVHLRGTI